MSVAAIRLSRRPVGRMRRAASRGAGFCKSEHPSVAA